DKPIRARRVSDLERIWRWGRRNPVVARLLGALAAVAVLAFAGVSWGYLTAEAARREEARQRRGALGAPHVAAGGGAQGKAGKGTRGGAARPAQAASLLHPDPPRPPRISGQQRPRRGADLAAV